MQKIILTTVLTALTSCVHQSIAEEEKVTTPKVAPPTPEVITPPEPKPQLIAGKYVVKSTQRGKMSWYSVKTNGGTVTASGKKFSDSGATAAHRKLRFGTKVKVTNLSNGRSEIVTITDRGPFIKGRIIDVSIGTARKLNFVNAGVVPCKVEVLGTP